MKIKIKTELLSLLQLLLPLLHELCKCAACNAADKTEHWRHTHTHTHVCVCYGFSCFSFRQPLECGSFTVSLAAIGVGFGIRGNLERWDGGSTKVASRVAHNVQQLLPPVPKVTINFCISWEHICCEGPANSASVL